MPQINSNTIKQISHDYKYTAVNIIVTLLCRLVLVTLGAFFVFILANISDLAKQSENSQSDSNAMPPGNRSNQTNSYAIPPGSRSNPTDPQSNPRYYGLLSFSIFIMIDTVYICIKRKGIDFKWLNLFIMPLIKIYLS